MWIAWQTKSPATSFIIIKVCFWCYDTALSKLLDLATPPCVGGTVTHRRWEVVKLPPMTHETSLQGGGTIKRDHRGLRSTTIHMNDDSYLKHLFKVYITLKKQTFCRYPHSTSEQLGVQCLASKLMDTYWIDLVTSMIQVSCSSIRPQYFPKSLWIISEMLKLIPDLWSLPKQLLLLQSQSFLLDLLQSHLIVASHDSAVGAGRQRPSLLHWSTLGDPLLVQGCKRDEKGVQICRYNM